MRTARRGRPRGLPRLGAALVACALAAAACDGGGLTAPPPVVTDTASIEVVPGMAVQRAFGAAMLHLRVAADEARIDVSVSLGGRTMAARTLTPDSATMVLDLANGGATLRGSLAGRFAYPGARASLAGDFVAADAGGSLPFRGDVIAWSWDAGTLLGRRSVWITPELRAETSILFDRESAAQVRFITGTQTLLTLALSQGANEVVFQNTVSVGTVRIDPGLTLQLQPATPLQQGQVYLRGTFGSSNISSVEYAGAIATWSYVGAP